MGFFSNAIEAEQPNEDIVEESVTEIEALCDDNDNDDANEVEKNEKSKDFIGPSDAMKELMSVLEFNAIDMYR